MPSLRAGRPWARYTTVLALTQSGATTVVEQQDAWLIRLNSAPAAQDAYFAGWDATGSVFTGGYSIHHALGSNKQYVGWSGQAVYQPMTRAAVGVNYESTFWSLVNGVGKTGAGASGGAVFDPGNRVVGSETLALLVAGENTAGVCPVQSHAPASTANYTALSGVWTSTADATSTTGERTLQSVLDPTNTGKMVIDGFRLMPVSLTADTSFLRTDQQLTLTWNAPGALSCTASGGWSGCACGQWLRQGEQPGWRARGLCVELPDSQRRRAGALWVLTGLTFSPLHGWVWTLRL